MNPQFEGVDAELECEFGDVGEFLCHIEEAERSCLAESEFGDTEEFLRQIDLVEQSCLYFNNSNMSSLQEGNEEEREGHFNGGGGNNNLPINETFFDLLPQMENLSMDGNGYDNGNAIEAEGNYNIFEADNNCEFTESQLRHIDNLTNQFYNESNNLQHVSIISRNHDYYSRFKTACKNVVLKLKPLTGNQNPTNWLTSCFREILQKIINKDLKPTDRAGITIRSVNASEKVFVSVRQVSEITAEVIMECIQIMIQSNENFNITGPLYLTVVEIEMPNGGIRSKKVNYIGSFDEFCSSKTSIVSIKNTEDNLCLPRAIVVGLANLEKTDGNDKKLWFRKTCDPRLPYQKQAALKLCEDARVNISEMGGGTVPAIIKFQNYLRNYTITVFADRRGKEVIYKGPDTEKYIDLIYFGGHYNVITSVTGAFTTKMYCRPCKMPYQGQGYHRCPWVCKSCMCSPICEGNEYIKCDSCNRTFKNRQCLKNHKDLTKNTYPGRRSLCDVVKFCLSCYTVYSLLRSKSHKCGYAYCSTCAAIKPIQHLCYIRKLGMGSSNKFQKKEKVSMMVFFDLECTQETEYRGCHQTFQHVPNFCVVQNICTHCEIDEDMNNDCRTCGKRLHIFDSGDVIAQLFTVLTEGRSNIENVTVLAHNAKGYDAQFVLKYIIEVKRWIDADVIMTGGKIHAITYKNLRFIDSLNYFSAKLSALPKMFNITNCEKGYFPHYFNKKENENYVGEIPPKEQYGYDEMTTDEREKFITWWEEKKQSNYIFNFRQEIKKYCISDVDILRKACLIFRKLFLQENKTDPFREGITIASVCMSTFRKSFLEPDTIAVIPPGGYRMADRQSKVALQWLTYEEKRHNIKIEHAASGREVKIGGFKVDGFCPNFNGKPTVWEFLGCYFHGCPICYKNRIGVLKNGNGATMNTLYESTNSRLEHIKSLGYSVINIWECQFKESRMSDPYLRDHIANMDQTMPIDPRDCLFGGRTNCITKYYKADEATGERILYYDVCSLYPYICKYGQFPVKHPTIYFGENCPQNLDNIEGIAKITIIPPRRLYHPLLPTKIDGSLMFVLCFTCAKKKQQRDCHHTDDERALTGTWVTLEIKKAIQLGYKIKKIHEIWKYQMTQYNGQNGGLFVKYINRFLKLKQQASGYPIWCTDEEKKKDYIKKYNEKEGILLDENKIEYNPGLRSLSKLCLNSFWGKFAQRGNLPQTSFVNTPEQLYELVGNPSVQVNTVVPINNEVMYVLWEYVEEAITSSPFTNVIIASYVTAQARLKLYSYLEELQTRVLYFDTDSVIFTKKVDEAAPDTGDYLGDLTDEIGTDRYICEFVSGGPKNYCYKIREKDGSTSTVCKVKGITLNYETSKVINFDTVKGLILQEGEEDEILVKVEHKIQRKERWTLVTAPQTKLYRAVFRKRKADEAFGTLPYGFTKIARTE